MGIRLSIKRSMAVVLPVIAVAVIVAAASGRPANITWHFFQKAETFSFTDSSGHPINPNQPPPIGAVFAATDRDYLGNHKHHARQYVATDHIRCVVTTGLSAGGALGIRCDGQIAIGGSMLLADGVNGTLTQTTTSAPLNGGTGKYQGYKGLAKTVSVSNTASDLTVTIHR
jgi:hypothetical protein